MQTDPSAWATGRLLSHVARGLERRWNNHLDTWGLNHASLPVLLQLINTDHSQRELAATANVTDQTMSRIVAKLERLGYVTKTPDQDDARRVIVHLTPAGSAVASAATRTEEGELIVGRGLSSEQIAMLREILIAMVRADPNPPAGRACQAPHTSQ